ncbi:MAG: helix-turn-helix domain-containing protein [Chloroflexi bacterium]|nr:helix-turn-helix domain-containing protein [Chloroflexota bacterium]
MLSTCCCKRGKSLRAIAAELGRSKTTIARALSEPVDQPPVAASRQIQIQGIPSKSREPVRIMGHAHRYR